MTATVTTHSVQAAGAPVLRTFDLTKRYGSAVAVDRVNLSVRAGEVYGFLGQNGAGKTTTMRMLLGLIRPTAGSAEVLGRPPGHPAGLARIGAMVETPAFYPYRPGGHTLEGVPRHGRVPRPRVAAVLERVGLTDRARDRFASYSLGMKQRLGVAAALLKDPDLLILDEPTNGLDPVGMAETRDLIRELGAEGKAILLSSHLLGEVQQICDRVGVVFKGRLVTESTVEELRGATGLAILATPHDRAEACLVELVGRDRVLPEGAELHLEVGPDNAAWLNRELMKAGVDVHELRRAERSLEDVFLSMTAAYQEGGDRDAA